MRILLINQNWFQAELRALGHEVASVSYHAGSNLLVKSGVVALDEIKNLCFGDRDPEIIVFHDNSMPILISGLEKSAIPRVFFSVDVHHHYDIHSSVGKAFDHVLLAQKDYAHHFSGIPLSWFPLWASNYVEPSPVKEYGAVFVGTLNPKLNPDRVTFFTELQKHCDILVKSCPWEEVFPKASIVVNQTVKGDLNFRVFEVMMSGACLLTEDGPNGLLELFTPGVHLMTYKKGDVHDAAEKIRWLTAHPEEASRIAKAGRDEILAKHTAASRAQQLEQIILPLSKRDRCGECYGLLTNYTSLAMRLEQDGTRTCETALSAGMMALQEGMRRNEPMTEEIGAMVLLLLTKYESYVSEGALEYLLRSIATRYPAMMSIKLGLVRMYLNRGQRDKAYELAAQIIPQNPTQVFSMSEKFLEEVARPWAAQ